MINVKQFAKFVVDLGDQVAPTDIEEGMRVGYGHTLMIYFWTVDVQQSHITAFANMTLLFNFHDVMIYFSDVIILLSLFQGWQKQVPNTYPSPTKDWPNSHHDAGKEFV